MVAELVTGLRWRVAVGSSACSAAVFVCLPGGCCCCTASLHTLVLIFDFVCSLPEGAVLMPMFHRGRARCVFFFQFRLGVGVVQL